MKKIAVIVAGGKGERMGGELPKQFLKLGKLPVLMQTILAFRKNIAGIEIILVLPQSQIGTWKTLCEDYHFDESLQIVPGGETRFQSVKNGLELVPENALVAVHDGVRPFVSKKVIENCFSVAEKKGNAIPSIPLNDSIREIDGEINFSQNRQKYRLIQTPQCFHSSLLRSAYEKASGNNTVEFTDDASVMEAAGHKINLTEGDWMNIKITTPADLIIGEGFLKVSEK